MVLRDGPPRWSPRWSTISDLMFATIKSEIPEIPEMVDHLGFDVRDHQIRDPRDPRDPREISRDPRPGSRRAGISSRDLARMDQGCWCTVGGRAGGFGQRRATAGSRRPPAVPFSTNDPSPTDARPFCVQPVPMRHRGPAGASGSFIGTDHATDHGRGATLAGRNHSDLVLGLVSDFQLLWRRLGQVSREILLSPRWSNPG